MNVLVTGGAGFIGSHLVDALVARGDHVRVLDDLCTGYRENVAEGAEFHEGSVSDPGAVDRAVEGSEVIFHVAAHRAVSRSVEHPLETDLANTHGTLVVLEAAARHGARRVVYSSSSSIYGGAEILPTPESTPAAPRSPYAVTKLAGEHYCRVFNDLYGLETVALRYFNVYGPRQRPDSQYAGVIPLFVRALGDGERPEVHGDGLQSRDFTYVADAVDANLAAAAAPAERCAGRVYNVAGGVAYSLLDLLAILGEILAVSPRPLHVGPRVGDVRHSLGDAAAAGRDLGFECSVPFREGLASTVAWYRSLP